MQGTVSGLVASYGYVVLFFLVGLESLGLPLPGETALVTAAAFAALGHLSIYAVVATAGAPALITRDRGVLFVLVGGTLPLTAFRRVYLPDGMHLARGDIFF